MISKFLYFFLFIFSTALVSCSKDSRDLFNMPGEIAINEESQNLAAISFLSDAIINNPSDPNNYFRRAKLYFKDGNFKNALVDINRSERLDPNNGEFLMVKAQVLYGLKNSNALATALKSEELAYSSPELYTLIADIFIESKNQKSAAVYIEKANAIYPYSADLSMSRGKYFLLAGDTSTAMANFKRGLELGKHTFKPYKNLIDTYLGLSIIDSANKYTDLALAAFPKNKELIITKGQIMESSGNFASAIEVYKNFLKLEPERYDVMERIANIYFRKENYSSAFLVFDELFKSNTEELKYLRKAAACYEQQGKYQDAIDYLNDTGDDFEDEKLVITDIVRLNTKIENGYKEQQTIFQPPVQTVTTTTIRKKPTPKPEPTPEPERRIFNSSIGNIEKIQKRSGLNIPRDTIR